MGEKIYSRPVKDTGIYVRVYTSIVENSVRKEGRDAIRVAGIYISKDSRKGITSSRRVNRTGTIPDIVNRMYSRMRESWSDCCSVQRCYCGAPKFKSKAGNIVCADACWVMK